jgi:hypothetical protein
MYQPRYPVYHSTALVCTITCIMVQSQLCTEIRGICGGTALPEFSPLMQIIENANMFMVALHSLDLT